MERSICIHCHFYQPPRENPWLEIVEVQDSAFPYHDWNERILAECYAPNSASRLLDGEGCITDIVSNYENISFNFGPTLLSWIKAHGHALYDAILASDARSVELHSGHGNAIAQVYNHMIMPLANRRDKQTQVLWGIADFKHRFKRDPEGMWLAETAVDLETLDILAEQGIKYTILAPRQAARIRKTGVESWHDVKESKIDPTRSYVCILPSGRTIVLFFYDGPISQAVAFEKLLDSGERLANRLMNGFSDARHGNQLVNIATDGESYGHHHKFGDMALAYALHYIEEKKLAKLVNYGEYLAANPPQHEVQIFENSSWSCVHGVERWKSNCGCNSGGRPGWNQEWRAPLRDAFDWLRDLVAPLFDAAGRQYLHDPWLARDDYVSVILDRSPASLDGFFKKHATRDLDGAEKTIVLELLEMQRHAMLMYTSCGWFFDELSGIETVQVIFYAGRVVQLAEKLFKLDLQKTFAERLSRAKSNIPAFHDGGRIYETIVKPVVVDLRKVAAHFAISCFVSNYGPESRVFCYKIDRLDGQELQSGEARLWVGKIRVTSDITLNTDVFTCVALHLGGHVFNAGVRQFRDEKTYVDLKTDITATFHAGNIANMIRHMDREFGMETYSLVSLFRDEQRKILSTALAATAEDFEDGYRHLYENHRGVMSFLQEAGMPIPRGFKAAAEFTIIAQLKKTFVQKEIDPERVKRLVAEADKWGVPIDSGLEFMVRRRGEELFRKLRETPYDNQRLLEALSLLELYRALPVEINYWIMQNVYFEITRAVYKDMIEGASRGTEPAQKWLEAFRLVGDLLFFNVNAITAPYQKREQAA